MKYSECEHTRLLLTVEKLIGLNRQRLNVNRKEARLKCFEKLQTKQKTKFGWAVVSFCTMIHHLVRTALIVDQSCTELRLLIRMRHRCTALRPL